MEVWLEAGREGRVFTYSNPDGLPLAPGDLVRVRLQGRPHGGLVVAALNHCPANVADKALQPVLAALEHAAVHPDWQRLITEVARQCHTSAFRTLRSVLPPGWLGARPARGSATGRQQLLIQRTEQPRPDTPPLPRRQRQLLDHLDARGGQRLLRDLIEADGFGRGVVRNLETRGLLRRQAISRSTPPPDGGTAGTPLDPRPPEPGLTPAQAAAVSALLAAPAGQETLLWGVTGAGKTEVYLRVAAHHLDHGRCVLMLTPEIGLVPQLLDRARQRFGPTILEYHSGLTERERIACWRACRAAARGDGPRVVVGTRSAIFLPLAPLGLIVLDEEHDASWKQESPMPCYHAREVARLRCRLEGSQLLLGSATPSLESWLRVQPAMGSMALLTLPERIGERPLPAVRVVDMRQELAEGHRRLLSRPLLDRLTVLRERGEQAVVLVPRRGYRSFLSCRSCGTVVQCPHCDVALTVHRRRGGEEWLRCHWCDHRQALASRCPQCGSSAFKPFGAGTQRVMERLEEDLEGLRVLRFDADTTRGRDGHRRVLDAFRDGQADVLVGTQMLAKGMDLPSVTLAAVLAADGLLHRPDLRAGEQCLQLLFQLAGRAGRGERPGEVLVQTYSPDHPVIRHLVDGRYGRFLTEEAALRRNAGLVPFSRACLLRLAGPSASATATSATALAERLRSGGAAAGWFLIGPAPAPVARVAGRSRWQILLHGPAESPLPLPPEEELRRLLHREVSLAIDPDPLQL
ncbi:MAG: primosomal protein N' [Cyanobacteria bacterium K_Offshore_surface_m2_239]|nr:primosomal protein N' [Cyanobacteria bacterium K_Offshore_surface_m2_239]